MKLKNIKIFTALALYYSHFLSHALYQIIFSRVSACWKYDNQYLHLFKLPMWKPTLQSLYHRVQKNPMLCLFILGLLWSQSNYSCATFLLFMCLLSSTFKFEVHQRNNKEELKWILLKIKDFEIIFSWLQICDLEWIMIKSHGMIF